MADATLQFGACPKCGTEGKYLKSSPVTASPRVDRESSVSHPGEYIVLVLWCTFCGWFVTNDDPGSAIGDD